MKTIQTYQTGRSPIYRIGEVLRLWFVLPRSAYVVFLILSNIFYAYSDARTFGSAAYAVGLAGYTTWTVRCCILFGTANTFRLQIYAVLDLLSTGINTLNGYPREALSDTEKLIRINALRDTLLEEFNTSYACSCDRIDTFPDSIRYTFVSPYGISVPFKSHIHEAAKKLKLSERSFETHRIDSRHFQISIPLRSVFDPANFVTILDLIPHIFLPKNGSQKPTQVPDSDASAR